MAKRKPKRKTPAKRRAPSYGIAAQRQAERLGYVPRTPVTPPPPRERQSSRPAKYRQTTTYADAYGAMVERLTKISRELEQLHRRKDSRGKRLWHGGRLKPVVAISPGPNGTIDAEIKLANLPKGFAHNKLRLLMGRLGISLQAKGFWISGFTDVEVPPGEYIETDVPTYEGMPEIPTAWKRADAFGAARVKDYQKRGWEGWKRIEPKPGARKAAQPGRIKQLGWRWHWSPENKRPVRRK